MKRITVEVTPDKLMYNEWFTASLRGDKKRCSRSSSIGWAVIGFIRQNLALCGITPEQFKSMVFTDRGLIIVHDQLVLSGLIKTMKESQIDLQIVFVPCEYKDSGW